MKHVFVTGATGFVGANLVRRLLESSDTVLYLLMRETEEYTAEERMRNLLLDFYSEEQYMYYFQRVHAIKGDLCQENLGISDDIWSELSQKIDTIFHSAATVYFNQPYEQAREINLIGTKRVLALASKCHENKVLKRFNHLSTAFIAGNKKRFYETDYDLGQEFTNTYEETKLEAELEVLKHINNGLPAMIFRPSLVTGNYRTGEIARSSIIFIFIHHLLKGNFKDFICNDDTELNFVPVDYVVDAMLHITRSDANLGKSFNLINKKNENVKHMITKLCSRLYLEAPGFYTIDNRKEASKLVQMTLSLFIDYMNTCHTFDDTLATEALKGSGIACPEIDGEFLTRLYDYIVESTA